MSFDTSANRRLACIMFTDVVGYTLLMGEDEARAFEILEINRQIHLPIIKRYGGRLIKELGDGILCTFSSVTDSVLAAADIQNACKGENRYSLRIGVHLSEVVFENNDVFGDGVNIAARIQTVATVGGILISEALQKNLANKKGIETKSIGPQHLKHVKDPVVLYEVIVTDEYVSPPLLKSKTDRYGFADKKSIAVLPFRNLSRDPEQEYFSDGVAEEIIITLSNIENLKVMGRSTSFQFKGGNLPVTEIGAMLGVNTILEGSVRRVGSSLRINVELINIADGSQMWADRYDRELRDIYEIQDDIAANVAKKLKVRFFGEETKTFPVNMEAYEMLLKGRFYVEKYVEGFERALACFSRAIQIDPNYGEAYAELAKVHFLLTMNLFVKPREGFERARFYAEKALSINNELGAAHYVLGQISLWYDWDFARSKREFEIAEQSTYSFYFTGVVIDPWYRAFVQGDYEAAINSILKILETDPLSFYLQFQLGFFYVLSRQFEAGRQIFNKMLEVVPDFSEAERILAYSYLLNDENEIALEHAKRAAKMAQGLGWAQNLYIITLAKAGYHKEAREELAIWLDSKGPLNISPLGIGIIYSHLGELDTAFDYFNKAIEYRDSWAISFKYDPEYDHLRDDPRFTSLIEKIEYRAGRNKNKQ